MITNERRYIAAGVEAVEQLNEVNDDGIRQGEREPEDTQIRKPKFINNAMKNVQNGVL